MKITSAICKETIDNFIAASEPSIEHFIKKQGGSDWKRVSKIGSDGLSTRTFVSYNIPIKAVVLERPSGLRVQLKVNYEWDTYADYDKYEDVHEKELYYEQTIEDLYKRSTIAAEFYFYVGDSDDGIWIMVCPRSYFDREGCCYDQSFSLDGLLPASVDDYDIMEATWEPSGNSTIEELKQDMIDAGFVYDQKFWDFLDDNMG